ncbi:MAG: RibD family protein [Chloroflexota bacterium]
MERLLPDYQEMEPGDIYQDLAFPVLPEDRPYTAINMVATVDGKAALDWKAFTIGSKVDHQAMRRIRAAADGVMVGGETLRRENVNPSVPAEMHSRRKALGLAPQPVAIVVTASADLPLTGTFFRAGGFPPVVMTTEQVPKDRVEALKPHARVLVAGRECVDPTLMMKILVDELGVRRLVVEGGPNLNGTLLANGLVDELFCTVAPKMVGGSALRTIVEGPALPLDRLARLELVSLYHHENELFCRYRIIR